MNNKMLSSFEISGFRAYDHIKLERIEQVNLIVGKNNVGKSSLLDALWLYANQGSPSVLWSSLEVRDEGARPSEFRVSDDDVDVDAQISSLRYLFHGRKQLKPGVQKIEIGTLGKESKRLTIRFILGENLVVDERGNRRFRELENLGDDTDAVPGLAIQYGQNASIVRLERLFVRNLRDTLSLQMERPCVFLPANGLSIADVGAFWDKVTLSPQENDVLEILKIIEPDIERVNLIGSQKSARYRERIPIIKIRSFDDPIPLKSLGEGMNRLFGIALALVNCKDGVLLIDEVESGLHYSVHSEMWQFIFKAAKQLNAQIFATTHSWDCISAFQQAAQKNEEDGLLIRLENKKGKIIPTYFDEKELAIVAQEQIEVR